MPKSLMKRKDVTPSAKIIWAYLRNRQGENSDAWPSHRTIGRDCGLSRTAVIRAIAKLEDLRMLEKISPPANDLRSGNRYRVPTSLESGLVSNRDQSRNEISLDSRPSLVSNRDSDQSRIATRSRPRESEPTRPSAGRPTSDRSTSSEKLTALLRTECPQVATPAVVERCHAWASMLQGKRRRLTDAEMGIFVRIAADYAPEQLADQLAIMIGGEHRELRPRPHYGSNGSAKPPGHVTPPPGKYDRFKQASKDTA